MFVHTSVSASIRVIRGESGLLGFSLRKVDAGVPLDVARGLSLSNGLPAA